MSYQIRPVPKFTSLYDSVLAAAEALNQKRYVDKTFAHALEQHLFGTFDGSKAVGFLLMLIQVIGSEEGRTPILRDKQPLTEGYVEAFGVLPEYRRLGIGQKLQQAAMRLCQTEGCYQIRSRSPVSAVENYGLKLKMGYCIHPSHENDSYFFIKVLTDAG